MSWPLNRMLFALLAATLLASCGPPSAKFEVKAAPAVTFQTVKGETIPLNSLRGKVVLVNFWATDCPICLQDMPELIATHKNYHAQGYETVAVAMWYDPPNRVVDFAARRALPFKVAFDPVGDHAKAFGEVTLTPTTLIIDRKGNIVSRIVGKPDFAKLHQLVEKLLREA